MKICLRLLYFAFLLLMAGPTVSNEKSVSNSPSPSFEDISARVPILLRPIQHNAFGVGEKLKFEMEYEFIPAGEATLEVQESVPFDGRPAIRLHSDARSNKFVDVFFKVRDVNESVIDEESLASVNFHQNLKEGHYRVIRNTHINYSSGTFHYEKYYKGKKSVKEGFIDQPVSDILSSFFYSRILPLELGEAYDIIVFSDGEVYPLRVSVLPNLDTIKVPAGKFECKMVRPQVVGDAIFKAKDGKMTIWMTNDHRHMPVKIESKVFIGSFDGVLVEYTEPPK